MKTVSCPRRRTEGLLQQEVADEVLVYDERRHCAFCLNGVAAALWLLCDGSHRAEEMASVLAGSGFAMVDTRAVEQALVQFQRDGLLEPPGEGLQEPEPPAVASAALFGRRRLLGGLGAGAALAVPVIAMLATPTPAQAYGGCVDCSAVAPSTRRRRLAQQSREDDARNSTSPSGSEEESQGFSSTE